MAGDVVIPFSNGNSATLIDLLPTWGMLVVIPFSNGNSATKTDEEEN